MKWKFTAVLCAFLVGTFPVSANDKLIWHVNFDVSAIAQSSYISGVEQQASEDFYNIQLSLDLYYKGFFINNGNELRNEFVSAPEIGYELIANEKYSLDALLITSYFQGFDENNADNINNRQINELSGITRRNRDASQAIRFSRFFENSVYWIDLGADLLADYHNGWIAETH